MAQPLTREELLDGYAAPYARWLPLLYRLNHVGPVAAGAAALALATALVALLADGGAPGALVALATLAVAAAVLWTLWVTIGGVRVIHRRTAQWRATDDSELARVRARRPHAADADRGVAHDEFAVSVDERRGHLVTWRFAPLAAQEAPQPGDGLLTGTPRYAVREAGRAAYDARDAALAAEQLASAQQAAAERERSAAEATRAALADRDRARELAAESASTGAALRGLTGQSPR